MYGQHSQQSMDNPGKNVNPARSQLNGEIIISLSPFAPEDLASRDGFGRPLLGRSAHSLVSG